MDFPQSTIAEITESERQMVTTARERFGNHFLNAWACSAFLSKCVVSVNHDRMNFTRFLALMKKHHILAILSIVRLHLRQALEAGAAAAFAIANPDDDHFFKVDQNNIITIPQKLAEKRYRWLEKHFKVDSDAIKAKKELINNGQSHANVVSADTHHQPALCGLPQKYSRLPVSRSA